MINVPFYDYLQGMFKTKYVTTILVITGLPIHFYYYTKIEVFSYPVGAFLFFIFGALFLVIKYQKSYYRIAQENKILKVIVMLFSTPIWFFIFAISLSAYTKVIIFSLATEKVHSVQVHVTDKMETYHHKTAHYVDVEADSISLGALVIVSGAEYHYIDIGDKLIFTYYSKGEILYSKMHTVKLGRLEVDESQNDKEMNDVRDEN